MKDKLYEEVGTSYRFFLNWRHASAAGYIVVLGGVMSFCLTAYKDARPLLWIVPLFGTPFGIFFWIVDRRIRSLFQTAVRAGRTLEGEQGGFFTEQEKIGTVPGLDRYPRFLTHSSALSILYIGSSVALIGLSLYFKYRLR
jgi:hypothetical protein